MAQLIVICILVLLLISSLIVLNRNEKRLKNLTERFDNLREDTVALDRRAEALEKILLLEKDNFKEGLIPRIAAEYSKALKRGDEATTPEELHNAQIEINRWADAMRWAYDYLI